MIKLNKYNVTDGNIKARVTYKISNRIDKKECVTIYAKDYDRSLGKIFKEYVNDTELQTDYFDKGRVNLFSDNPLYEQALKRAEANQN